MIHIERIPAEESRDLVVKDNPTGTLDNVSHLLNHSKRYRRGVSPEAKPDVTVFLTRNEFGPAGKNWNICHIGRVTLTVTFVTAMSRCDTIPISVTISIPSLRYSCSLAKLAHKYLTHVFCHMCDTIVTLADASTRA